MGEINTLHLLAIAATAPSTVPIIIWFVDESLDLGTNDLRWRGINILQSKRGKYEGESNR
jgi:hypothetical protein